MKTEKEKYHGLITQRITVESAALLVPSRIQGATKTNNWKEETIHETMGINDMTITTTSNPSREMSNESYWQSDF